MNLWQQVQQLFDAALQHSPDKRQEFLEQECGSNQELRREVESSSWRLTSSPVASGGTGGLLEWQMC